MSWTSSAASQKHERHLDFSRAATENGQPKLNPSAAEFRPPRSRSENTPSNTSLPVIPTEPAAQPSQSHAGRHDGGRGGGRGRRGGGEGSVRGASGKSGALSRALQAQGPGQVPPRGGRGGASRGPDGAQRARPNPANVSRKQSDGGPSPLSRSPGNANHLLGFHYEERAGLQGHSGRVSAGGSRNGRRAAYSNWRPKPYNKEHFLQANFRFVVSDGVDVRRYMEHADRMFDWEDVLQVEVSTPTMIQCPISLESPPIVPVLTSCGHIFSLHSIVHHMLESGGEKFCRASSCPLCFNTISVRDLRLVTVRQIDRVDFDKSVCFSLIRRPKNSILPQPEDSQVTKQAYCPEDPLASERFAKFVTVSDSLPLFRSAATALAHYSADVLSAGGQEAQIEGPCLFKAMDVLVLLARKWAVRRAELLQTGNFSMVVGADTGSDDAGLEDADRMERALRDVFTIEMAEEKVRSVALQERSREDAERDAAFPSIGGPAGAPSSTPARPDPSVGSFGAWNPTSSGAGALDLTPPSDASQLNNMDMPFEFAFGEHGDASGESEQFDGNSSPRLHTPGGRQDFEQDDSDIELLGSSPNQSLSVNQLEDGSQYFLYQSSDGQWLFMHPINVRCLLNHYTKFSCCPVKVDAKVIEVEDMTQTEPLRKKLQALSHLPLTAEFKLCEVDLSGLLPEAALAPFKGELQQRAKLRAKRAAMARRSAEASPSYVPHGAASYMHPARDAAAVEDSNPRGPTIEDLSRMPLPHEVGLTEDELAESLALQASVDDANINPAPSPGAAPSYATLTRLGLAATGPALGSSLTGVGAHPSISSPPVPRGAWGSGRGHAGSPAPALRTWVAAPPRDDEVEAPVMEIKNKKGQKVLRLTSGGR